MRIDYPEGIELWKPARVTVTGLHGGTFPIGGGPAGKLGTLVYDATVYATDDEGFPYWFTEGGPSSMSGNFEARDPAYLRRADVEPRATPLVRGRPGSRSAFRGS